MGVFDSLPSPWLFWLLYSCYISMRRLSTLGLAQIPVCGPGRLLVTTNHEEAETDLDIYPLTVEVGK